MSTHHPSLHDAEHALCSRETASLPTSAFRRLSSAVARSATERPQNVRSNQRHVSRLRPRPAPFPCSRCSKYGCEAFQRISNRRPTNGGAPPGWLDAAAAGRTADRDLLLGEGRKHERGGVGGAGKGWDLETETPVQAFVLGLPRLVCLLHAFL